MFKVFEYRGLLQDRLGLSFLCRSSHTCLRITASLELHTRAHTFYVKLSTPPCGHSLELQSQQSHYSNKTLSVVQKLQHQRSEAILDFSFECDYSATPDQK